VGTEALKHREKPKIEGKAKEKLEQTIKNMNDGSALFLFGDIRDLLRSVLKNDADRAIETLDRIRMEPRGHYVKGRII